MKIQHEPALSNSAYLRLPQILELIPIGRSTWWLWVSQGKAPKGVKLGPRTTAWKASEIQQLLDKLAEGTGE